MRLVAVFLLLASGYACAQDDTLDGLKAETAELRRLVADQQRRITELEKQERRLADLEKTIRALQAALAPPPHRIPASPPEWHQPLNWGRLKAGMSEAQVMDLLGPPSRVQSVVDTRTLYYLPEGKSANTLHGSVTLTDDRIIAVEPPQF